MSVVASGGVKVHPYAPPNAGRVGAAGDGGWRGGGAEGRGEGALQLEGDPCAGEGGAKSTEEEEEEESRHGRGATAYLTSCHIHMPRPFSSHPLRAFQLMWPTHVLQPSTTLTTLPLIPAIHTTGQSSPLTNTLHTGVHVVLPSLSQTHQGNGGYHGRAAEEEEETGRGWSEARQGRGGPGDL